MLDKNDVVKELGSATKKDNLVSLFEASKLSPYSQEYISLLVRRGKIFGEKVGRNWFTTTEAVEEYVRKYAGSGLLKKKDSLISLAEASRFSPYSQEYISLLVRRGKIFGQKVGRNWFTTKEAIQEYVQKYGAVNLLKKGLTPDDFTDSVNINPSPALPQVVLATAPISVPTPEPVPVEGYEPVSHWKPEHNIRRALASVVATILIIFGFAGITQDFSSSDNPVLIKAKSLYERLAHRGQKPDQYLGDVVMTQPDTGVTIIGSIPTPTATPAPGEVLPPREVPVIVRSITNAEKLNNLTSQDFTLAFVTKNGNVTYDNVRLQGNVEIGKTLTVNGATQLRSSLAVQGKLGVIGQATFNQGLKVTSGNVAIEQGTLEVGSTKMVKNLNAELWQGLKPNDLVASIASGSGVTINNITNVTNSGGTITNASLTLDDVVENGNETNDPAFFFGGLYGGNGAFSSLGVSGDASIGNIEDPQDSLFTVQSKKFRLNGEGDLVVSGTSNFGGNASFSSDLEASGFASASQTFGSGLTDCDVTATSKLLWDSTTGKFSCGTDQTGGSGSGSALQIKEGLTSVLNPTATISFEAGNFNVSASGSTEVVVKLDWTNGPASRAANETITGGWRFSAASNQFSNTLEIGIASASTATIGTLTATTINAFTLGGTVTGGGNTVSNLGQLTVDNLRLDGNTFDSTTGGITIAPNSGLTNIAGSASVSANFEIGGTASISGATTLRGVTYTWPSTQGSANSVLRNNGSGTLSWDVTKLVTSNSIDFDEIVNAATLDANFSIASAGFTFDLTRTDFEVGGTASIGNTLFVNKNNGNVGIGTTNADTKLSIRSSAPVLSLTNSATNRRYQIRNGVFGAGVFDIYDSTASASRILIDSGGNVAIGSSSISEAKLFVSGVSGGTNANVDIRAADSTQSSTVEVQADDFSVNFQSAYLQYLGSGVTGNIFSGIPKADLALLAFQGPSNALIYTTNASPLIFGTDFTERARLTSTGNFGIGTNAPLTKLEVQGTASASNLLTIGSLQVANAGATVSYSRFGTNTTSYSSSLSAANDLLVSGDLEVDGNAFFDSNASVAATFESSALKADTLSNSTGTLTINAFTLGGTVTGGGNTVSNLGQLTVDNLRLDGNTFDSTTGGITIAPNSGLINITGAASVSTNFEASGYASASKTYGSGLTACDSTTQKIIWQADGTFTCATDRNGSTSLYADADIPLITIGNTSSLSFERALTGTTNQITVTDNGANSSVVLSLPQDIHTGAAPTFAGIFLTNGSVSANFELTGSSSELGVNAGGNIDTSLEIGGTASISGATTLRGVTYTWPSTQGSANSVLRNNGSGTLSWDVTKLVTSNSIDFDEIVNAATLDANFSVASTSNGYTWDFGKINLFGIGNASVSKNIEIGGYASVGTNLLLPTTGSNDVGSIKIGSFRFLHSYGSHLNTFVGSGAGNLTLTGIHNVAVGAFDLQFNTSGNNNAVLGSGGMYTNTTGSFNAVTGAFALYNNSTGSNNVALGYQAGYGTSTNNINNSVFLGYQTGSNLAGGDNNILIGYRTGDALTTGSGNILLGYDIDAPSATSAQTLSIGNLIFGTGLDGTGTNLSTGFVGIGTNAPSTKLEVQGTSSASYGLFGSLQVAGFSSTSYSRFGTNTTGYSAFLSSANDLLISGDLEVDGSAFFDNNASVSAKLEVYNTAGTASFEIFSNNDGEKRFTLLSVLNGLGGGVNDRLALRNNLGTEVVSIASSGDVYIGSGTIGRSLILPPGGYIAGREATTFGTNATQSFAEGSIRFAFGSDPVMKIDSGENNDLSFRSEGPVRFKVGDVVTFTEANNGRVFVGIGTTAPSTRLEVQGTSSASYGLFGTLQVAGFSSTSYSRFGINTTGHSGSISSANDLLISGDLEVDGNAYFDGTVNFAGTASASLFYAGNGTAASPSFSFRADQDTGMWRPTTNELAFSTLGAERLRIDVNGNIGLGVTTPSRLLEVGGSVLASAAGDVDLTLRSASVTNNDRQFTLRAGLIGGSPQLEAFSILNGDEESLIIIASNGNVTIGNTNPTSSRLTIEGRAEVQGTASASYLLTGNTLQVAGFSSAAYSRFGTNTTSFSSILSSSNDVLISGDLEVDGQALFDNFASLSGALEITPQTNPTYSNGPSGAHLLLQNNAGIRGMYIGYDTTTAAGYIGVARYGVNNQSLLLNPDGYLGTGGNVGIGPNAPEQRLEVAGNIFASSSANVDLILRSSTTNGASNNDDSKFIIRAGSTSEDLLFKNGASGNLVTIASTGTFTVDQLSGSHGFITSGTGNNRLTIQNSTSCTTCLASFAVVANETGANQQMFSSGYTTSGSAIASSYRILALDSGGISIVSGHSTGGVVRFYTGAVSTERARFDAGGRLGLGTTTPVQELHIASASDGNLFRLQDSDGTCDHNPEAGAETVTCSSDVRLKDDIVDAAPILNRLMDIRIRDYTVKASGDRMTGVIAQELQQTWPEMVASGSDGFLMVHQPSTWQIIKALQEQQAQITEIGSRSSGSVVVTSSFGDTIDAVFKSIKVLGDSIVTGARKTYIALKDAFPGEDTGLLADDWNVRGVNLASSASAAIKSFFSEPGSQPAPQSKLELDDSKTSLAAFGVDSTRAEVQVSGTGTLVNGEARVYFDKSFSAIISESVPVKVILTPLGEDIAGKLYVSEKSSFGFVVKSSGALSNSQFDWLVVARRKGYDNDAQTPVVSPEISPVTSSSPTPNPSPETSPPPDSTPLPDVSTSPPPESTPIPSETPLPETPAPVPTPDPTPVPEIPTPSPDPVISPTP